MTIFQPPPTSTALHDSQTPLLVATKRHSDARGWFSETFNERSSAASGIGCRFVQDNQSMSLLRGTVRGLHYQVPPKFQAKLVRVTRGRILDVAVDIRQGSPTYGQHVSVELSEDNGLQLYIPVGFAHGFCTLEDATEVSYKVSDFYSPDHDRGLLWNDPRIAIPWPITAAGAIVSEKDAAQPLLDHLQSPFAYRGMPLAALTL